MQAFRELLVAKSGEGWEYVGSETFMDGPEPKGPIVLTVFKRKAPNVNDEMFREPVDVFRFPPAGSVPLTPSMTPVPTRREMIPPEPTSKPSPVLNHFGAKYEVIPLKHTNASDVAKSVMNDYKTNKPDEFAHLEITTDPRLNALVIAKVPNADALAEINKMIIRLDVPASENPRSILPPVARSTTNSPLAIEPPPSKPTLREVYERSNPNETVTLGVGQKAVPSRIANTVSKYCQEYEKDLSPVVIKSDDEKKFITLTGRKDAIRKVGLMIRDLDELESSPILPPQTKSVRP